MDVDNEKATQERGHSANSIHTNINEEEWEEFEHVACLMDTQQDQDKKYRFCW